MAKRSSSRLRAAGALSLTAGGLVFILAPGFSAPARKPAAGPITMPRKPPSTLPMPKLPGTPPSPGTPGPGNPGPGLPGNPDAQKKPPLPATPPPGDAIMKVSEVKAGMKGYGLTVFRGDKIERFEVEVMGVMPKSNMGEPLVLVRLSGGPITERGAYLIQGMSGSPIYINGKLLGAFSMGNPWPKEPLGMVTPIEDMLEALDPKLSEVPAGQSAANFLPGVTDPITADTGLFRNPIDMPLTAAASQSYKPLALPVSVSGLSPRNVERVAQFLSPFNMSVAAGPGSTDQPIKPGLAPGAALGVALMTGDVEMTGIGTVTYRKGDQMLAFGHPMMQIGAAQFPITTAWIHDVFPGLNSSFKIGSAGQICGTLTQDRPFSIAGRLGSAPPMVPIHCVVNDQATGRKQTFNVKAASHPLLVGQLLPVAVNQALFSVRPVPGDTVADVKITAETDGAGTIVRHNKFYDPAQIDVTAVRELQELMGILNNNTFRRVPVKSLDVEVTYENKLPTATVDRIFLSQDKFEPGEDAEVGVVLRPYRKDPVVLKTKIKIPESAANGRAILMVQGGMTRVSIAGPSGVPGAPAPDASLKQVVKRFTTRERNDQIAVRLVFPSLAVNVNGERLSQLPSSIVDVMRSSKSTGFRIERDEVKKLQDTDYIVQGLQALEINVQRKDQLEKPKTGESRPGVVSSTGGPVGSPSAPGNALSTGPDMDDMSVLNFSVDGKARMLRLTPEIEEVEAEKREKADAKAKRDSEKKDSGKKKSGDKGDKSKPGVTSDPEKSATTTAPAATATPAADEKLVGRQALIWTQTSQADFERGTMTNTAVSTSGDVRLAPGLKLVHETVDQFVWSVAGAGGNLYAGTGNGGDVLKVDANGTSTVLFRTGELEVHALAKDGFGNLYAGTSPRGKIFRITPDGKGTELLSMLGDESVSDAGGKFVLSLAAAKDGTVYAGTGPNGKVYKIAPGASSAEELCALPAKSVTSLLVGSDGTVYAGTGEDGVIYKIEGRTPHVVYDTDQSVITGLAMDPAGNIYAAGTPGAQIYQISKEGTPKVYFNKGQGGHYGLLIDGSGGLYTCTANSVLRIEPNGSATILSEKKNVQFTGLAWDETGHLIAGGSNMGSVYRLTPAISGIFESTIHDAKLPSRWGRVRFNGVAPAGAVIKVQTRSGNTPEADASWSEWADLREQGGSDFVNSPEARYLQYRVLFQAENGSPSLREISVSYLPRNQQPRLLLAVPQGGEIWKGTQTLKWSAIDPDGDTMTYEVSYSADGGRTWKLVGEHTKPTEAPKTDAAKPDTTKTDKPAPNRAEEALTRYKQQLEADKSLTPAERDANYEKARALVEHFIKDNPNGMTSGMSVPAASASTSATPGVTRQAQIVWDTRQVPDGIYVLRVTASDKPSNPNDALSDTKISEPVIVSNTPPQVFVFEKGITVNADKTATVVGFASGRVTLKGAQYRVGTGEWTAIDAEDGLWDSAFEHFRFTVPLTGTEEQSIEVKVVDAAGNPATVTVKAKAP